MHKSSFKPFKPFKRLRVHPHNKASHPKGHALPPSWRQKFQLVFAEHGQRQPSQWVGILGDALLRYLECGGPVLDLSHCHRIGLHALPAEAVQAFAQACMEQAESHALQEVLLPEGLRFVPPLLRTEPFQAIRRIALPGFVGRELDLSQYANLQSVFLGEIKLHSPTLRVPHRCQVDARLPDKKPVTWLCWKKSDHLLLKPESRIWGFNGQVAWPDGSDNKFECRHLALEKARCWADDELREMFMEPGPGWLSTASAIAQNVSQDNEHWFNVLDRRAAHRAFVHHALWNEFAQNVFDDMRQNGERFRYAVLILSGHALTLRFDMSDPASPLIESWDSNAPPDSSQRSLPPFSFSSLLFDVDATFPAYCGSGKLPAGPVSNAEVIWLKDPRDLSSSIAGPGKPRKVCTAYATTSERIHPALLYDLMRIGYPAQLLTRLKRSFEAHPPTAEECITLFNRPNEFYSPALFAAVFGGHADMVRIFVDLLLAAHAVTPLAEDAVVSIMESNDCQGNEACALAITFQRDDVGTMKAMRDAILGLWEARAISPASVAALLRANLVDGSSGIAWIKSHQMAQAFEDALNKLSARGALTPDTDSDIKAELSRVRQHLDQTLLQQQPAPSSWLSV